MPTYEYQCPRCGTVEISQSITEPARSRCPLCAMKVRRLVSAGAGFILDPGGFWETGRDGRERKIPRSEREREWQAAASRKRPLL